MTIYEFQQKILRLKKEKDICILAHSYQAREIIEVADFTGDSYQLSVQAKNASQKTVIMCGVRFMAETVKLLSPHKTVLLANSTAGCQMAEQMDKELIERVKEQYPGYTVVAYINTTAEASDKSDFIIGTEISIAQHLSYQCPKKHFYTLSKNLICPNMKATSLVDVYYAVSGVGGEEILLDDETIEKAYLCIDRMIELG